jgi:hypothetical protein
MFFAASFFSATLRTRIGMLATVSDPASVEAGFVSLPHNVEKFTHGLSLNLLLLVALRHLHILLKKIVALVFTRRLTFVAIAEAGTEDINTCGKL